MECCWEVAWPPSKKPWPSRFCISLPLNWTYLHYDPVCCKVSARDLQLLTGHSDGTVDEDYIHKENRPMSLLKEGIELLKYLPVVQALSKR